ncbi:MAG: bifunctional 4-hydroxy-2-oxoglutarate aldolase/2-dehydro-3-deoxy-phosphogluconate aldolase [Aeromonas sp.]
MQNWNVTPDEVFATSALIPVMVINQLDQALPMVRALQAGGISVFEIALRTPVALDAIALIRQAMPDAMVGAGTVLNAAQFDAAVAAGARFIISPGMTPALLAHGACSRTALIPGVATPSEVMQALDAGYQHVKFFPAQINGGPNGLSAIAAALPPVTFCPTGGIGLHNLADYLALECVAAVGGSWMLPADIVHSGNWQEVTRLTRASVALLKRS